jgi:hypothetical protein
MLPQHWSYFQLLRSYGGFRVRAVEKTRVLSDEFIATFYDTPCITVRNVRNGFHCTTLLIPNKRLLPVE